MKNKVLLGSIFVAFCSLFLYLTNTARVENTELRIKESNSSKINSHKNSNFKSSTESSDISPDSLKKADSSNASLANTIIQNIDNATSPIQVATQNLGDEEQSANIKNIDQPQDVNSVLKLFVLIAYEKENKASQNFKVNSEDVQPNDSALQAGVEYSGSFLKNLMMHQNNNDAANVLLHAIGKEKVNEVAKNIGASETEITGKFGEDKVGKTTADDLELVLKKLYQGKIKNTNEDNQVLDQLKNYPEKGLASQVSGTVYRISDKYASVALVKSENGKTYIMSSVSGKEGFNFEKVGTAINSWYSGH